MLRVVKSRLPPQFRGLFCKCATPPVQPRTPPFREQEHVGESLTARILIQRLLQSRQGAGWVHPLEQRSITPHLISGNRHHCERNDRQCTFVATIEDESRTLERDPHLEWC